MLVDEAGMLDQDTARAVLTIADECGARLALMGDRHQLPAVGRGGVLDLAARWAAPEARLTLDTVHRFTHTTIGADGVLATVEDQHYARLSLAMRGGNRPRRGVRRAAGPRADPPARQRIRPDQRAGRDGGRGAHGRAARGRDRRHPRAGRRPQRRDP